MILVFHITGILALAQKELDSANCNSTPAGDMKGYRGASRKQNGESKAWCTLCVLLQKDYRRNKNKNTSV